MKPIIKNISLTAIGRLRMTPLLGLSQRVKKKLAAGTTKQRPPLS